MQIIELDIHHLKEINGKSPKRCLVRPIQQIELTMMKKKIEEETRDRSAELGLYNVNNCLRCLREPTSCYSCCYIGVS